ncbi:oxygen-dependent protoporphyrinogen oxidase [Chitinophaga sp. CF118]|uniref:protoporphyrinogen oxidase n=1 Tax=Chitinophaga sp. CF118 TaxID=1884367 RepID=UPI0008F102E1|nr:protoporphyrinogen oxidase [Chitinophaga sp. CF118]SFD04211.1 oxygen-dependent protoporphyrinogen oxidase [Chitinophaga sp. CF118]
MKTQPVIIVGAGLSGLSIAYELQKKGIPYQLLESAPQVGGVIKSFHINGYELDAGPNSIGATPETMAFIEELGLQDALMEATAASKNRFLVRNDQLHAVSPHPLKILRSKYVSGGAKWRLFTERFRKARKDGGEESVSSFVNRRFGHEIGEYLFEPVLSGIYAGNPDNLSIQEVLPMLPRWEKEYGSVTAGLMKNMKAMGGRKIVAFKGGNIVLAERLLSLLTGPVHLNSTITGITKGATDYIVQYEENGHTAMLNADRIIFTTPAYITGAAIATLDAPLAAELNNIHYPHMGVLHLGFGAEALSKVPAGFGFLVPHAAKKHFLGAICNSAIFPSRAPEGKALFTIFTGGARKEHLFEQLGAEKLQKEIISEFMSLLGLETLPELQHFSEWKRAIPQLNVGHVQIRQHIKAFEQRNTGIQLAGSYVTAVAVPAIIQAAKGIADKM